MCTLTVEMRTLLRKKVEFLDLNQGCLQIVEEHYLHLPFCLNSSSTYLLTDDFQITLVQDNPSNQSSGRENKSERPRLWTANGHRDEEDTSKSMRCVFILDLMDQEHKRMTLILSRVLSYKMCFRSTICDWSYPCVVRVSRVCTSVP